MLHILGINGSQHRVGHTNELLSAALMQVRAEGAQDEAVQLNGLLTEQFHPEKSGVLASQVIKDLVEKIVRADGLIIATPVNWFGPSSLIHTLICHLPESPDFPLQGKPFGVIAHCEEDGGNQACMAVVAPLVHMGMILVPYGAFFMNSSIPTGGEDGWQNEDLALLGANVVHMATIMKHLPVPPKTWGYEFRTEK